MFSNRARLHTKSNKRAAPALSASVTGKPETGHPLVGMTQTFILRSTTALGSFSNIVHGCCEKISQAFVFARMTKEMAALTKMCQAPFQNMPSMFNTAQSSSASRSAAQPAMGGFQFWSAAFSLPALAAPSTPASPFAQWTNVPASMEAAAIMIPAAAFFTAVAEVQAQLPKVFAAFFGWA